MPTVLSDELVSHAVTDDTLSVLSWHKDKNEITAIIGKAFSGTASTQAEEILHWVLGPELATIDDPLRNQVGCFAMRLALCTKGPIATTLAARDDSGNSVAVAVLQKLECAPPESTLMNTIRTISTIATIVATCRMPQIMLTNRSIERRADTLPMFFGRLHEAHANFPHIYLAFLGTNPPMQGKGHAGALLRAVNRIADASGMPVYLETGEKNRSLYEHFGYKVMGKTTIQEENKKGDKDTATATSSWSCPLLAMLRCPHA